MAALIVLFSIVGVGAVCRALFADLSPETQEARAIAEAKRSREAKKAGPEVKIGTAEDDSTVAREGNASQGGVDAPAVQAIQAAEVEYVDCKKQGAPKWCRRIGYATAGERRGTVAVVVRGDRDGKPGWCGWTTDGYRYFGDVGNYVPEKVLTELDALAVTLVPRGTGPTAYRYFVAPKGTDASGWKWMDPCPL